MLRCERCGKEFPSRSRRSAHTSSACNSERLIRDGWVPVDGQDAWLLGQDSVEVRYGKPTWKRPTSSWDQAIGFSQNSKTGATAYVPKWAGIVVASKLRLEGKLKSLTLRHIAASEELQSALMTTYALAGAEGVAPLLLAIAKEVSDADKSDLG